MGIRVYTWLLMAFFAPAVCLAMAGWFKTAAVVAVLEVVGVFLFCVWARASENRNGTVTKSQP
jgi:hypothetical protein